MGGGLSGVLRDEIAVDIEHVTSVRQVHDVCLVVVSGFRDYEVRDVSHKRIHTLLPPINTHTHSCWSSR